MSETLQSGLTHLDPDQLNAFVEGALADHERVTVLAHLADCADCRETVFLAQQAAPPPVELAEQPVPFWRSWFSSGPLLAAATAGLICALGLTVFVHLHHSAAVSTPFTTASLPPIQELPEVQSLAPPIRSEVPHLRATVPSPAVSAKKIPEPREEGEEEAKIAVPQPVLGPVEAKSPAPALPIQQLAQNVPQNQFAGLAARHEPSLAQNQDQMSPAAQNNTTAMVQTGEARDIIETAPAPSSNAQVQVRDAAPSLPENGVALNQDVAVVNTYTLQIKPLSSAKPIDSVLPSHEAPVSVASHGNRTIAVDAKGNVYLTLDAGRSWNAVFSSWQGKAVRIAVVQPPSMASRTHSLKDSTDETVAVQQDQKTASSPTPAEPIDVAPFQLTTDSGQVWISVDGLLWKER